MGHRDRRAVDGDGSDHRQSLVRRRRRTGNGRVVRASPASGAAPLPPAFGAARQRIRLAATAVYCRRGGRSRSSRSSGFSARAPAEMGLQPYRASPPRRRLRRSAGQPVPRRDRGPRHGTSSRFWLLAGASSFAASRRNGLIGTHFDPRLPRSRHPGARRRALGGDGRVRHDRHHRLGLAATGSTTDPALLVLWLRGHGPALSAVTRSGINGPWGLAGLRLIYGLDWIATVPPTSARDRPHSAPSNRASSMAGS